MKKKTLIAGVTFLFAVCGYFVYFPIETVIHGSLAESFKSVDELKEKAEVIAEVKINKSKSFDYETMVYTLSEAQILSSSKGELSEGDKINILETGGRKGIENLTFEGNEVFQKGEEAIVFLEKYEGPITDDAYVIKGVYQGKFKLEEDGTSIKPAKHLPGKLSKITNIEELGIKEK